ALNAGGMPPNEPEDGPWFEEPDASRFWGHLYRRLYAFLGRMAPTAQNGYRVVAGVQAANYAASAAGVSRLAEQAGVGTPTCTPSADAILARHLAEQRGANLAEAVITVVAVGDTATTVCSYRIQHKAGSPPRIAARETSARHLPFGQAHWTGRLLIHVNDLF